MLGIAAAGLVVALTATGIAAPPRPQGPCDIFAKAGTPCVAAHSTTRALYAAYNGPLYQVKRESDGRTLDIGVVEPSGSDSGGYSDARAQDAFCAKTICVVQRIYDQSGRGNDLLQAGPGTFKGPAKGGFDTQPIADMAPITISRHKAYGVYIMPGMGFRNNNANGIAIDDESEGIYYVVDGRHYDNGCCFDYGNSSTNGRAVGSGTMETTYFGTSTAWGRGSGPGPWIMSDMEAGLFSGHGAKENSNDPTIDSWRFVTAVMDGGGGDRWNLRGGNAQTGTLATFYSGERPAAQKYGGYWPMRKQGGILLGTGGDNGNGSAGTFYEGVITSGFPSEATTDAVQANIVAAHYDVARVGLSRLITFTPGSAQDLTETFTNTTGAPVTELRLGITGPSSQWRAITSNKASKGFAGPIAPDASVSATFHVTSAQATGAGFLTGKAEWNDATGGLSSDTATERVRNVLPVKINEVRFGLSSDPTDQFIELYNASTSAVDISRWSLVSTRSQWAPVKLAAISEGTSLAAHGFYLLGLSNSGLAAPASAGAASVHVRSTAGFAAGQKIDVDGETRAIKDVGTESAPMTMLFAPVSTGPWLTIPAGATNLPVVSTAGFEPGQKIGIDIGGNYEIATVTAVGNAATQTTLSAPASAGATNIKLAADANISAGDALTISTGARKEIVKVASVGTIGAEEPGVRLVSPLRLDHSSGVDVSDVGTGVAFSPATRFPHMSGDAVQALGSGITLDHPLTRNHGYGAPVLGPAVVRAGYTGGPAPNQWFGDALSPSAGSIALMDATGSVVVDAIVYGSQQSNSSGNGTIASPELATLEGDQSGGGCIAVVGRPAGGSGFSVGRFPDGADTDSNCNDFRAQAVAMIALASPPGATNIKVNTVDGFHAGQIILIDPGPNEERATIEAVGAPGATTTRSAIAAGDTLVPVANAFAFRPGQAVTIGQGAEQETIVVAASSRRGVPVISIGAPLKFAHASGTEVAGTGITLKSALSRAHARGAQIADDLPTPGAPNNYTR
jgi:hypothetical protein